MSVVVVKLGGNAINDGALLGHLAADIVECRNSGNDVVLVHGAGPQIDTAFADAGIERRFVDGLRVTTPGAIDIIDRVMADVVRPQLVELITTGGASAAGYSGHTSPLLRAERHSNVELERVGEVIAVDVERLRSDFVVNVIPVISTLAQDTDGHTVNVNADSAAAKIAAELHADSLLLLTNVKGIYRNYPDESSLIGDISSAELHQMLPTLTEGMIPKVKACLTAVDGGAGQVCIVDGGEEHVVRRLLSGERIGTKVSAQ